MKFNILCGAVLATLFSVAANAQLCTTPTMWTPNAAGMPSISGNTCDLSSETGIVSLCESAQSAAGRAYVVEFTVTAAGTWTTISLTNTGFTGYMAVVDINALGACNGSGDTGHCITAGDISTPIDRVNVPNGTYYLIVSNSGVDTPLNCGPFTLSTNGTFPVKLQNFTVS